MPDSAAKKKWMAENTVQVTAKLNRNQDKDIVAYFGDKIPASKVKEILREYMKNHPKQGE